LLAEVVVLLVAVVLAVCGPLLMKLWVLAHIWLLWVLVAQVSERLLRRVKMNLHCHEIVVTVIRRSLRI
jgi:hypothetical protein